MHYRSLSRKTFFYLCTVVFTIIILTVTNDKEFITTIAYSKPVFRHSFYGRSSNGFYSQISVKVAELVVNMLHLIDINKEENCSETVLLVLGIIWFCEFVESLSVKGSGKCIAGRKLEILLAHLSEHISLTEMFNGSTNISGPGITIAVIKHSKIIFCNKISVNIRVMENREEDKYIAAAISFHFCRKKVAGTYHFTQIFFIVDYCTDRLNLFSIRKILGQTFC